MLLERELIGFLGETRLFVDRVLQLRLVADDRLLLFVMLRVQRRDGVRRVGDCPLELGRLLGQAHQRLAVGGDALAQFFDLALGLENAARLRASTARHQMRAAEHVAVERRHRQRRDPARRRRCIVRPRDARFADRMANRAGVRSVHAHDRRHRDDAVGNRWVKVAG